MDLFEDCIEALKDPKEILSDELTEQYFETLNNNFPITSWAKIDWGKVPQKESIETYDDLYKWLKFQQIVDTTINLLWNPSDVPACPTEPTI